MKIENPQLREETSVCWGFFFKSSLFGELLKKEARIDRARQVDELQIRLDEGV